MQPADDRGSGPDTHRSTDRSTDRSTGGLTDRDVAILAFERQWWKYAGAKEQAIRERFDVSSARYYQLLSQLIERRDALEHDPMLVKRLRRQRSQRRRQRTARRLGIRT